MYLLDKTDDSAIITCNRSSVHKQIFTKGKFYIKLGPILVEAKRFIIGLLSNIKFIKHFIDVKTSTMHGQKVLTAGYFGEFNEILKDFPKNYLQVFLHS